MSGTGLVWERDCLAHHTGAGHPESPRRLEAIRAGLEQAGLWSRCQRLRARPARRVELLRCHSAAYLELVERELRQGCPQLSTGDTPLSPGSERAALLAAGGALTAVEAVMAGTVQRAFVALRPPGHHATADRGMGFCIYNNVAVAARHAQAACGAERVLILDWDVHHGNGSQEIFWRDPSVFYCSLHQMPLYPGSGRAREQGEGPGAGTTLNLPLPAGSGGEAMRRALHQQLDPLLERFRPSLLLVSAGFDAMAGDPLADLRLNAADVTALTKLALEYAERYAQGRLVSLLEGGYNLDNLAAGAVAHVGALLAGPVAAA
jgi:acetoin utilization deacetylase AcuC-like enzyme